MDDREKVYRIFNLVYEKTQAKTLKWIPTNTENTAFGTDFDDFKLVIAKSGLDYMFYISKKSEESIIAKLNSKLLALRRISVPLAELFEMVKNQSLGIDDALNDLLAKLSQS